MRISDWSSDVCSSDLYRLDVAGMGVVVLVDAVDLDAAVERREGHCQGGFGEAVARQEGLGREAGNGKGLGEALERLGAHHLAADTGDAPDRKSTRLNYSH